MLTAWLDSCTDDADRYEQERGVDNDVIQPGNLSRLTPPEEQGRLIDNSVIALKPVRKEIQQKMVAHLIRADKAHGDCVARGLGL